MINIIIKIKTYTRLLMVSLFVLLLVSILFVGLKISLGYASLNSIKIPTSELRIVGKEYDSSIRIYGGETVIFADCKMGMQQVCNQYHNKSLWGKDVEVLSIDHKFYAIIKGTLSDDSGANFEINFQKENLGMDLLESKRIYPKFFFYALLILLPVWLVVELLTHILLQRNN